ETQAARHCAGRRRPRRAVPSAAGRSEGSATPPCASALTLLLLLFLLVVRALVVRVLALVLARVVDQLVRIFREIVAVHAHQRVVLEVERQVLVVHDVATATDRRDVVPEILVERADD